MEKTADLYVLHMLEAISNIEADIAGHDFDSFRKDRRTRQLVERNLEILSEASRRIPDDLKVQEGKIPWKEVAGIGNILSHDYHQTYPTILWDTCQQDLRPLKDAVLRIKKQIGTAGGKT